MFGRVCPAARALWRTFSSQPADTSVSRPLPPRQMSFIVGDASVRPSPASTVLATRDVLIGDKLTTLGNLTTPQKNLYQTSAHVALLEFLLRQTTRLNGPGFGVNGTHARTIVGAKGIGKSTVLIQYVKVVEAAFSNVIGMYVSYSEPRSGDLLLDVIQQLVTRGVMDADWAGRVPDSELVSLVLGSLEQSGKRMLLVVDEMDQLYRVDHAHQPTEAYAAYKTLGRLAALGDRGGHCTSVLLCGSSTVLPQLITANGTRDDGIRKEYPGVVGAPNLNGTKYSEFRLTAGLPTDLHTAQIVCESIRATTDLPADKGNARLALFVAGSAPRYLEKAWVNQFSASLAAESAAPSALSGRSKVLYTSVMTELRRVNSKWMEKVRDNGQVSPNLVRAFPWESEMVPLEWERLVQLWARVCIEVPDPTATGPMEPMLQSELLRLCDKNFLSSDNTDTVSGAPNAVYPQCASQLFFGDVGTSSMSKLVATYDLHILAFVKKHTSDVITGSLHL
jgi:hypothetical protein